MSTTSAPGALRIGMIGAGGIARMRHVPGLRALPNVELMAVANRVPAGGAAAAREFGFRRSHPDWQTLLADDEVDAVFVCTPPVLHAPITLAALRAGKHVFCQGRMATGLPEARAMLAADRDTTLTTMLCPPPHYMALEHIVRRLLVEGRIGEVRHVVVDHPNTNYLDPDLPRHWRQVRAVQGVNVLDIGVTVEVLHRLFGPVQELSATAATWVTQRRTADGIGPVELPDSVGVVGRFASGPILTGTFSGAVRGGTEHMVLHGSEGTLIAHAHSPEILLNTGGGLQPVPVDPAELRGWTVERDFVTAVLEGRKGAPSFEEGARYMAFSEALVEGLGKGGTVRVEPT